MDDYAGPGVPTFGPPIVKTERHPVAGEKEEWEVLAPGTRIRSTVDPNLTGVIKSLEWNKSRSRGDAEDVLSPIPYCIGWDNDDRAHAVLGMLFVYAGREGVEPA